MAMAILWHFAEEERRKKEIKVNRRTMRDACNPLTLPNRKFMAQFRLSKAAFGELCREVITLLQAPKRKTKIRDELKVLAALKFYGRGSYQRSVAASFTHNMSQAALSNCLEEVTNALNNEAVLKKYIKFPTSRQRRENIMTDFMRMSGMPGTIGCIDCIHIAIIRPVVHKEAYHNQKGSHSLNVLVICDHNLNILHIDASYGGAAQDDFIWEQSEVKTYMEKLQLNGERCWLLGDSGFPQRDYLMTPILGATENSPEENYNAIHCRTHNVMQQCLRVLKARWKCLWAHHMLHYNPTKAGKIVNACAVLHNIANSFNVPVPQLATPDQQAMQSSQQSFDVENSESNMRKILVQRLSSARTLNV